MYKNYKLNSSHWILILSSVFFFKQSVRLQRHAVSQVRLTGNSKEPTGVGMSGLFMC